MDRIEIINYSSQYQLDYKELSLEWLYEYNLYEDADGQMLDHPKREVFDKGGYIFLAKINSEIVGTVVIIPAGNNSFEIFKLGVKKNYQRLGIGKALMELCIQQSKAFNAEKIILETNSKLKSAIRLYTKLGFKEVALHKDKYQLSDKKMELLLK